MLCFFKYAKNITEDKLEHIFLNSLIGRSKNYPTVELFTQEIIKSLLKFLIFTSLIILLDELQNLYIFFRIIFKVNFFYYIWIL